MSGSVVVIAWEYADGSCGAVECDEDEDAGEWALAIAEERPDARIWLGDQVIQAGFVAADERGTP